MKTNPKLPLDSDDIVKQQMVKNIKQSKSLLNYLEIIPIVILIAGVYLQRQSHPYWSEIILLGAGIAGFLYLFFSWFLFRVGDYRSSELTLSVLAGFFSLSWDVGYGILLQRVVGCRFNGSNRNVGKFRVIQLLYYSFYNPFKRRTSQYILSKHTGSFVGFYRYSFSAVSFVN